MSGQNMQGGQGWYGGQGPMGRGVMQPPQVNRQMPVFASRFGNRGAMPPGWFGGPGTQRPGQTQWALNQYGGSPVGTGGMFGQINLPQGFQPSRLGQVPSGGWALNQLPGFGGPSVAPQGSLGAMPMGATQANGLPPGWNSNYAMGTMGAMQSGSPPPGYSGPIF